MLLKWTKRLLGASLAGLAIAGLVWFALPRPISVDLAPTTRGPMEVSIEDEGKTRVRDIYTVSAPLTGVVLRITGRVGDQVSANDTTVAVMQPSPSGFHDPRSHEELQAELNAAEAALTQAEHEVHRIDTALTYSRSELRRAQSLLGTNTISLNAWEKTKADAEGNEAALESAKALLEVRRNQRAAASIKLAQPLSSAGSDDSSACCLPIKAPTTGRILRIRQSSEAVVQAGSPLLEIGDPSNLEVIADLLSSDAVQVTPGDSAQIDGWGGPLIHGRVVRIEPSGFVKVSALGIEEQRVRTTIELVDPPDAWSKLGDQYRVVVHIPIWSATEAMTVPVSALFRKNNAWAVYTDTNGKARLTAVEVSHRNNRVAEIVSGLSVGDQVVLHPSDRIQDGVSISPRMEP